MFNKMKKVKEAILNDDAAQVTKISRKMRLQGTQEYYDLCVLAVQNNASNALKALLEVNFGFCFEGDKKSMAHQLLSEALSSSDPVPLLGVLYDINKITSYGRLGAKDFFNKDTLFEFALDQLKKDPALSANCIYAVLDSEEKLDVVLGFASQSGNRQSILNDALENAAKMGNIEAAKMLLARQANPNGRDDARALLNACEGGHQNIVALLLPRVKPALCGYVAIQLQRNDSASAAIISSLEAAAQKTAAPALVSMTANNNNPSAEPVYTRSDSETLAKTQTLPDGSTLMTLFNFVAEEQQSIVIPLDKDRPHGVSLPVQMSETVVTAMREKFDKLGEEEKPAIPRPLRLRQG